MPSLDVVYTEEKGYVTVDQVGSGTSFFPLSRSSRSGRPLIDLCLNFPDLICHLITTAQAKDMKVKKLSGTKFRQMLRGGEDIPEWFAFKSVVAVLRQHARQAKA